MKKSIALLALAFGVTGAFAQDLTSKKGEPILPEADDWSIGIEATPFLEYAGNFFGKTVKNNAPTWNFFNGNNTISGKLMKDAQTAYRANIRIGLNNTTERNMVTNRMISAPSATNTGYPTGPNLVENKWKHSATNVGIAAGMEKRKGKTRLQGIYGAEVGFSIGMSKDKFTYGNTLAANVISTNPGDAQNVTPTQNGDGFAGVSSGTITTNGNVQDAASLGINGANTSGLPGVAQARMLERKSGMTFTFGVRAFIGAEYFFMPKMSFGGEFGWGIGLSMTGANKTTWESTGSNNPLAPNPNSIGTTEIKGAKGSGLSIDNDRNSIFAPGGSLRLNFYF